MNDNAAQIVTSIQRQFDLAENVMVVSHIDPDGDAIGTQLTFGRYLGDQGKNVVMVRDSEIPEKYLFLPDVEKIVPFSSLEATTSFDTVLILECPTMQRLGAAAAAINDNTNVISLDHHLDSDELGQLNWLDTNASSVGEMAFEFLTAVGYKLPTEVATCLYTAIMTDTGRFRYESTTPRTMQVVGELIRAGANPRTISHEVYFNMEPAALKLTGHVLSSMELYRDGSICLLSLTRDMLDQTGAPKSAAEGLVDHTLFSKGVVVGALLKESTQTVTRVSLRSSDGINVAKIASGLGGGGHFNAAGCTLEMPLAEAKTKIVKLLGETFAKSC